MVNHTIDDKVPLACYSDVSDSRGSKQTFNCIRSSATEEKNPNLEVTHRSPIKHIYIETGATTVLEHSGILGVDDTFNNA